MYCFNQHGGEDGAERTASSSGKRFISFYQVGDEKQEDLEKKPSFSAGNGYGKVSNASVYLVETKGESAVASVLLSERRRKNGTRAVSVRCPAGGRGRSGRGRRNNKIRGKGSAVLHLSKGGGKKRNELKNGPFVCGHPGDREKKKEKHLVLAGRARLEMKEEEKREYPERFPSALEKETKVPRALYSNRIAGGGLRWPPPQRTHHRREEV